jgi:hypothetical protein
MSASRLALLSTLCAVLVFAAIIDVASAKGGGSGKGGRDTAMSKAASVPVAGTSKQVKTFKTFGGKACRSDYNRLCSGMPIGKCDLQSKVGQLSPACRAFVQTH